MKFLLLVAGDSQPTSLSFSLGGFGGACLQRSKKLTNGQLDTLTKLVSWEKGAE